MMIIARRRTDLQTGFCISAPLRLFPEFFQREGAKAQRHEGTKAQRRKDAITDYCLKLARKERGRMPRLLFRLRRCGILPHPNLEGTSRACALAFLKAPARLAHAKKAQC